MKAGCTASSGLRPGQPGVRRAICAETSSRRPAATSYTRRCGTLAHRVSSAHELEPSTPTDITPTIEPVSRLLVITSRRAVIGTRHTLAPFLAKSQNGDDHVTRHCKGKMVKAFPYSIPSVGPGTDPDVQAVSPQVTVSHYPAVGCHYFPPGLRLPPQPQSIIALWPVPSYTA